MFFVYCGYTMESTGMTARTSSSYFDLLSFGTKNDLLKHHQEFLAKLPAESSKVVYRVITGHELQIQPVKHVVEYELVSDPDDE